MSEGMWTASLIDTDLGTVVLVAGPTAESVKTVMFHLTDSYTKVEWDGSVEPPALSDEERAEATQSWKAMLAESESW